MIQVIRNTITIIKGASLYINCRSITLKIISAKTHRHKQRKMTLKIDITSESKFQMSRGELIDSSSGCINKILSGKYGHNIQSHYFSLQYAVHENYDDPHFFRIIIFLLVSFTI